MTIPIVIKSPALWKGIERLRGMPVPFVADRYVDGRIDLASIDPRLIEKVHARGLCHRCGVPLVNGCDGMASTIVSPEQLMFGLSTQAIGHFECLGHAKGTCPALRRRGPQIIATVEAHTPARRPLVAKNDVVTFFDDVCHLTIAFDGRVSWHQEIYEEEGDEGHDYSEFAQPSRMAKIDVEHPMRRAEGMEVHL